MQKSKSKKGETTMKCIFILVFLIAGVSAGEVFRGRATLDLELMPQWLEPDLTAATFRVRDWSEPMLEKHYWKNYSASKVGRVYDPQHYLTVEQLTDMNQLLKQHSEISRLPIELILLGHGQTIPESMDAKWLWKRFYNENPAVVIYYFYGNPKSSLGYIHGGAERREIDDLRTKELLHNVTSAIARNASDQEQCKAFIEELSRRMYWIENELGIVQIDHASVVDLDEKKEKEAGKSKLSQWLDNSGVSAVIGKHSESITLIVVSLISTVFVLLVIYIYRKFCSYEFPLYGGPRRLGGKHGAGLGEIVSFKDASISLTEQKKKLKADKINFL